MSFTPEYEGFSRDLTILSDITFEQLSKKALTEVMPDVLNATKDAIRGSVKHSGESELVASVKCFEPRMTKDGEGASITCMPTGKSKSGNSYHTVSRGHDRVMNVNNNDKAFWLEYGTVKQPAKPWKDRAINSAESKATQKLQQIIERELGAE